MKVELFPFQNTAVDDLRKKLAFSLNGFAQMHVPQVISFTAPTGAGKTIISAALIENVYNGTADYQEQPEAIFLWLSDSPELNAQSRSKIESNCDRISIGQCVTISDEDFDQETLEDGHIYFLNTQKLSKSSNLVKKGDARTYTIWETLQNTIATKSDRLYLIIDEAHRGMQGNAAATATTTMQKFILGRPDDGLTPMPVVLGMSATPERFNRLVAGTTATVHQVVVPVDAVRKSGLLKDRIIFRYPGDTAAHNDMAVLQAAADAWYDKCKHWNDYCERQHYAKFNPVLVIQVENGTGDQISATDLDDCLAKIEQRLGIRFSAGEVVHTFGQTTATLTLNGLAVCYEEPSRISDDDKVKVVFFKENLSTGWDCPRAETMMSFRRANDATHIAQLLGRMIRTPKQMHIEVDDTLNDVHLYLPYFDVGTVEDVVNALQEAEGGELPTDIELLDIESGHQEVLSIRPPTPKAVPSTAATTAQPSPMPLKTATSGPLDTAVEMPSSGAGPAINATQRTETTPSSVGTPSATSPVREEPPTASSPVGDTAAEAAPLALDGGQVPAVPKQPLWPDRFDRPGVVKFINDLHLLNYDIRSVIISDYFRSLCKLAHFMTLAHLYPNAVSDVAQDVAELIHAYVEELKHGGKYDDLVTKVMQFKLTTKVFDPFGQPLSDPGGGDLFSTTDTDIDRQLRMAENKLGNEGIANVYGVKYGDEEDPLAYKIEVILFAADETCWQKLLKYAKDKFHKFRDDIRPYVAGLDETWRRQYDRIASDADIVSPHNFTLPETICVTRESESLGVSYSNHLFCNEEGRARFMLTPWEMGVLEEEFKRPDFVCWLRNISRASWALRLPYDVGSTKKPFFPDLFIVRKHPTDEGKYFIDLLEPHGQQFNDNLAKAKALADYAARNPSLSRVQLIREMKGPIPGQKIYKRLDMAISTVRTKVMGINKPDELDQLFAEV